MVKNEAVLSSKFHSSILVFNSSISFALLSANAVHGSDSDENAAIEGAFHFAGREQF